MSKPEEVYPQEDVLTPGSTTKVFPQAEATLPELEELTGPPKHWEPSVLGWKSTAPLCSILVIGGIALEIILYRSQKDHGFSWVRISATEARQFFKSFFAIALFLPILAWIGTAYIEMKVLQPYLDLARGDASSRNAITTEYLTLSPFKAIRKSYARRHLILATASCIMLVTLVFQPLAGSLFSVRLASLTSYDVAVNTAGTLAPSSTRAGSPTPFVAAAGFIDATLSTDGYLPSFILLATNFSGFTTPAFEVSPNVSTESDGDALITIWTSLLEFNAECAAATSVNITTNTASDAAWRVDASLTPSCSESYTIPNNISGWQGVAGQASPACITAINSEATYSDSLDPQKYPVAFGFFANQTVASVVFCYAYQWEKNGTATYDIYDEYLSEVTNLTSIPSSPLEDYCYNGLQDYSSTLSIGEGEAIALALADAVINGALDDGEVGDNFTQQNQWLSNADSLDLLYLVQNVYLYYVMVAANSIFVTGIRSPTSGTLFLQKNRLFAFGPAVHVLAVLCILTGLSLAVIFYLHAQQRRSLHLADRPATLGVAAAMLSRSRVSQILHPRDTNKEIERKLAGMRFGIDLETGAVDRVDRD